jgi:hypothetical protein
VRLTSSLVLASRKALVVVAILHCAVNLHAQMLDPAIDRDDEPFSYFSRPTDVIGVMDAPAATLVTPEGYLFTGFGELMLFTGNPPVPVAVADYKAEYRRRYEEFVRTGK